jgi:hypothetical protein
MLSTVTHLFKLTRSHTYTHTYTQYFSSYKLWLPELIFASNHLEIINIQRSDNLEVSRV